MWWSFLYFSTICIPIITDYGEEDERNISEYQDVGYKTAYGSKNLSVGQKKHSSFTAVSLQCYALVGQISLSFIKLYLSWCMKS